MTINAIAQKLLLSLIFTFTLQTTKAQIPAAWPDSVASWSVEFWVSPDPWLPIEYYRYRYFLYGDTVMNGETYSRVYEAFNNSMLIDTANATYIGGIREDSAQKVWFFGDGPSHYQGYCDFPPDTAEYLLYDFDIAVGDTLNIYTSFYPPYVVHDVDTISINGTQRRRWAVGNDGCINCEHWIEGVGSDHGLFYSWCQYFEWGWQLRCYEDPDIFYDPWGLGNPCYVLTSTTDPILKELLSVGPNPSNTAIRMRLEAEATETYHLQLFDSRGSLVLERDLSGGEELVLQASDFPKGVYHYQVAGTARQKASGKIVFQ